MTGRGASKSDARPFATYSTASRGRIRSKGFVDLCERNVTFPELVSGHDAEGYLPERASLVNRKHQPENHRQLRKKYMPLRQLFGITIARPARQSPVQAKPVESSLMTYCVPRVTSGRRQASPALEVQANFMTTSVGRARLVSS
jgi:hypothetical protein